DPVYASGRVLWARGDEARLCPRDRRGLPVLFLRRCLPAVPALGSRSQTARRGPEQADAVGPCILVNRELRMNSHIEDIDSDIENMIPGTQMRAGRALLEIDQRELAQRSGLSLPTIQRMEASEGVIRGNVDSLMKLVDALAAAGIELIGEGAVSHAGG